MRIFHLALGLLTLALLAAAAFGPRKQADAAPATAPSSGEPGAVAPGPVVASAPRRSSPLPQASVPERVEPETQRRQIEGAIESSGGAEAWSAPARRMVGDWMASSGEHLLSSRIDCHHDGCIARLRYRDRAALRAVTEAFEQKIEQWPGPKMQTPAHEVDGALSNEWIFFPPDDMRRQ